MERKTAEYLVDQLEKHPAIFKPDGNLFLGVLLAADVPPSSDSTSRCQIARSL